MRIAKSSLVAFERILSSFAAKPIRNATPCLVAFEHILNSFAAKPIRITNLTLLPRDVCGYAHANMAPLPRNQRCHSQKPVLPGARGAAGCTHVLHCLWQSKFNLTCLLQNSTGIPAPFEAFLWLALRRGPIFGAVRCWGPACVLPACETSILAPSARKHK